MYMNYMFDNYNEDYRNNENDELITLDEAINLIEKSVADEQEDELFYNNLINIAKEEKDKTIIASIRDDEKKHNNILKELYYQFTGNNVSTNNTSTAIPNLNYKDSLEKALFGELDAIKKYRKILSKMPNGDSYTLLMAIMTDEIRHACKYNFLIQKAGNISNWDVLIL